MDSAGSITLTVMAGALWALFIYATLAFFVYHDDKALTGIIGAGSCAILCSVGAYFVRQLEKG